MWQPLYRMEPRQFDPRLIRLCGKRFEKSPVTPRACRPAPLHDASEMAALVPTVMISRPRTRACRTARKEETPEEPSRNDDPGVRLLVERR